MKISEESKSNTNSTKNFKDLKLDMKNFEESKSNINPSNQFKDLKVKVVKVNTN